MKYHLSSFTYMPLFALLLQTLVKRNNVQCVPLNSDQESKLPDLFQEWVAKLKLERSEKVDEFHATKTSLSETIDGYGSDFTGQEDEVQNLLDDLISKWSKIEELSNSIASETTEEIEHINVLNKEYAESLFQAKARKCKSFEETFYKPESKCFPMEDPSGGPCPETQILFDGDHNEGVCLCKEFGLVFHKEFESCYRLNTQGPCEPGEWINLNSNKRSEQMAVCETIPDTECPPDGWHVFYKESCWELGSRGPCLEDHNLVRNPENWGAYVCSPKVFYAVGNKVSHVACKSGSKRGASGQCSKVYPGSG